MEVVQHTGLTDHIERMKAFTPSQAKRGLEEGKGSEGKNKKKLKKVLKTHIWKTPIRTVPLIPPRAVEFLQMNDILPSDIGKFKYV